MIFIIRMIVAFVLLAIASKQDIKTREVEDWIWKVMLVIAMILLIVELNIFGGYQRETVILELFLMAMLMLLTFFIFVGFNRFQKDSFGGADAKAFLCLAILLPYPLFLGAMPFSYMILVFAELFSFAFYFPKALKAPREEWKNITFPLMPFILIGIIFSAVIFYVEQIMV